MPAATRDVELGEAFAERYDLIEKIGEGGFGDVYKARQRATGQVVAVKVLRLPEGQSEQSERAMARFRREMRLCAELHHPNIVRLIDSGSAGEGAAYSVFEFVPGKTLGATLLAERRLSPSEARHLMMQVLDALACAHGQGIVHRDLKPENIMVVPTGARRNAVVLDFGIGAIIAEAAAIDARITRTNEWVGTPVYAAPEQIRRKPPLPRSDLYAAGLIFLECLTGHRPLHGVSVADVIWQQLSPDPVPIDPAIAAHPLGRILRRMTEKDPAARDVTAEGMLREIEACDLRDLAIPDVIEGLSSSSSSGATATAHVDRSASTRPSPAGLPLPAVVTSPRPSEGERRQITAVCCALSLADAASEEDEPDEIDSLLDAGQEACAEAARSLGAHASGALGDTMLFLFGYPVAREDDARRSARAALAMITETRAAGGARLLVRVGVHTGMIVTREVTGAARSGQGRLGGATPQAATQLCALAEPGEVLVSGETQRLLRGHFALERRPSRTPTAGGSGASTDVYWLQEARAVTFSEDTPLVGRQQEIDALLARWDDARRGKGQAVLVTGEPGIGKSRLTRALRDRLRGERHTYLEGRCASEATNSPFYPIVDMLLRLLDPAQELSAADKLTALAALLARHDGSTSEDLSLFAALLALPQPAGAPATEHSPQKRRELQRHAVLSLLFEMGERAPVVLLLEDMHWADPSTLELAAELVSEASGGKIFVVLTGRPEFSPPWAPSLSLHLGHLEGADIAKIAASVTGGRELAPEIAARIAARTDGVPLFVEELVQAMLESGALVERKGRLVAAAGAGDLAIPTTLRDSLMARLDRLGRAREAAQVGAAIGREFSMDLLRAVIPRDEAELRADLDALVSAGLVHRKRRLRSPTFLFKHALVQDTAYDSLIKGRRREIHERIARALVRDAPAVVEDQPELIARHLERGGLADEAAEWLLRAGRRALGRGASVEAVASIERGISLLTALSETEGRLRRELELRAVLSGAQVSVKGYCAPELTENLVRARALCDKVDAPESLFPVLYGLWVTNLATSHRAPCEAYAEQLFAFAAAYPTPAREVTACFSVGTTHLYRGRFAKAREDLRRAFTGYDTSLHPELVQLFGDDHGLYALVYLAWMEVFTGEADQARATAAEARALAERLGNPLVLAIALLFAAIFYRDLRDLDRALEFAEETIRLSTAQSFFYWRSLALCVRGFVRAARGDHEGGITEIEEGLAFPRLIKQKLPQTYWNGYLVEACLAAGRIEQGKSVVEEALADSQANLDSFNEPELLRLKGDLLAAEAGRPEPAIPWYERAIEVARGYGAVYYELRAAMSLARALSATGDPARGRACLAEALGKMREGHDVSVYREATRLLAELADAP